jgi:hypothetical protein
LSESTTAPNPSTLVQQVVQQLVDPLQEASKIFSTRFADLLVKQVQDMTAAFRNAHPAVARATDDIVGWSMAIAASAQSVSTMVTNTRDMIRNFGEVRKSVTKFLDAHPALDGLRLRLMNAGQAAKKMAGDLIQNTRELVKKIATDKLAALRSALMEKATKAWAAAQRVLNLVLQMNPLGLVIAGITVLIALFVLAYKRSATFRAIVQGAMHGVQVAIGWVVNAARTVFDWVRNHWPLLLGILTGPIGLAVVAITKNWDRIMAGVRTLRDGIVDVWNKLVDFFTGLPGRLSSIATGMWDGFKDAARDVIFFLIRAWNGLDFGLHVHLPGWLGGAGIDIDDVIPDIDIPALAEGAIVPRRPGGVLALIGEGREDEVVMPLSRLRDVTRRMAPPVAINVYPRAGLSEYEIGRIAARELAWAAKR